MIKYGDVVIENDEDYPLYETLFYAMHGVFGYANTVLVGYFLDELFIDDETSISGEPCWTIERKKMSNPSLFML